MFLVYKFTSVLDVTVLILSQIIWNVRLNLHIAANLCPDLPDLENGVPFIVMDTYHFDDIVTYQCDIGYVLSGSDTIICKADGTWSTSLPTCSGKQQLSE